MGSAVEYNELGFEAGVKALLDAHINYDDVEAAVACYCYGDTTCGQRTFYQFGMTQIPIYNVNNACATGSAGLHLARTLIRHGAVHCVMVVGFERMAAGSIQTVYQDRPSPIGTSMKLMAETAGVTGAPGAAQLFGNAGREYMDKYGARPEDFAEIARINHEHSTQNPYSQFRDTYTQAEILSAPEIHAPLTKLQCCPTSDGGGAAILVSAEFLAARPALKSQAVLIAGQHLSTDAPDLFDRSAINLVGYGMSQTAAQAALAEAKITASDVGVCELHDCFSANEMITLDALGLCAPGTAHEMVRRGDITFSSNRSNHERRDSGSSSSSSNTCIVNPSGGLISKGHPLGATGLAQCAELIWQLRGWAHTRLAPKLRWALQHNLGLGGAAVVTVYRRADGEVARAVDDEIVAKANGLGYNPAVEARGFTQEQVDRVRSRKARSAWALGDALVKVQARF